MPQYVTDCPRCGVKNTSFDLIACTVSVARDQSYEVFSVCRSCRTATVFILGPNGIGVNTAFNPNTDYYRQDVTSLLAYRGFVSIKDVATFEPPAHIPDDIKRAFEEGATCLSVKCHNAAAAMFRLCVDLATKVLLPPDDVDGLNAQKRRNLGPRLEWLFNTARLPEALRDLSACIKDHGNDGAHEGSVTEPEAQDILDFTRVLLERLYTEPRKLELAKERRDARRHGKG